MIADFNSDCITSESVLGRELAALTYGEKVAEMEYTLFNRLPHMALQEEWADIGPEQELVCNFMAQYKNPEPLLDCLEKYDFCKTFLKYEFPPEDSDDLTDRDRNPRVSLLPNFFFLWDLLITSESFVTSHRTVTILLQQLRGAVGRYRTFWDHGPFYGIYVELVRLTLVRLMDNRANHTDSFKEREQQMIELLSCFMEFAPKLEPVYPVCSAGHWMTTRQGLHRVCQLCCHQKAQHCCFDSKHEEVLCETCSFRIPSSIKTFDVDLVLQRITSTMFI